MSQPITVVCGLPRSGTTLMMSMLHAGGMEVYAQNMHSFETIKNIELPKYDHFLYDCRGKAVKLLDPLYFTPPRSKHQYRFIWMKRAPEEIAKSQFKFFKLENPHAVMGLTDIVRLSNKFRDATRDSLTMLSKYRTSGVLVVPFEEVLEEPLEVAGKVVEYLGLPLDTEAMAGRVMERGPGCLDGWLEPQLVEENA